MHQRNHVIVTALIPEAAENAFCEALKKRFSALTLKLPPLRERRPDIPAMASIEINRLAQANIKQLAGFAPGAMERLQAFSWPGNMDQFHRVIRELYFSTAGPFISEREVMDNLSKEEVCKTQNTLSQFDDTKTLAELELQIIQQVLQSENMNQSNAAKHLGISRSTLWRKLNHM